MGHIHCGNCENTISDTTYPSPDIGGLFSSYNEENMSDEYVVTTDYVKLWGYKQDVYECNECGTVAIESEVSSGKFLFYKPLNEKFNAVLNQDAKRVEVKNKYKEK